MSNSNAQVQHLWANQSKTRAQSGNGNHSFQGRVLYSYSTPIAHIVDAPRGGKVALITSRTYSVTTTGKHMPRTYDFPPELSRYFYVPFLGTYGGLHGNEGSSLETVHGANVAHFAAQYREELQRLMRCNPNAKRGWRSESFVWDYGHCFTALNDCAKKQRAYAETFGIKKGLISARQVEKDAAKVWARIDRLVNDPKLKRQRELAAASKARREFATAWYAAMALAAHVDAWLKRDETELAREFWKYASVLDGTHTYGLSAPFVHNARGAWHSLPAFRPVAEKLARIEALALPMIRAAEETKRLEQAANLAKWLAGEPVHLSYSTAPDGSAYLRRIGDNIETSRGARVAFADAVKLFKFAKLIRQRNAGFDHPPGNKAQPAWKRNGASLRVTHFELERVYPDGSAQIGCHFLSWDQIADAAKRCGVFETEAEDTTEHKG